MKKVPYLCKPLSAILSTGSQGCFAVLAIVIDQRRLID
jgi:hypothetical protein